MIYRQKIGIGFSTQSPSRRLSLCQADQEDNMAMLVRLVYFQQDGQHGDVRFVLFPINIDMSRLT